MIQVRPKIKFCGITRCEDVKAAVSLGVDALGFVAYPESKRFVNLEQMQTLVQQVPVWVSSVVLTVNASEQMLADMMTQVRPSYLQLHGDESPAFCDSLDYPYIRAIRVGAPGLETASQIAQYVSQYKKAKAFLFDAYSASYGGSGLRFDLSLIKEARALLAPEKVIIAGGLNAQNIQDLLRLYLPYALDLSSGIEESAGIKSWYKMQDFIQQVYAFSAKPTAV